MFDLIVSLEELGSNCRLEPWRTKLWRALPLFLRVAVRLFLRKSLFCEVVEQGSVSVERVSLIIFLLAPPESRWTAAHARARTMPRHIAGFLAFLAAVGSSGLDGIYVEGGCKKRRAPRRDFYGRDDARPAGSRLIFKL